MAKPFSWIAASIAEVTSVVPDGEEEILVAPKTNDMFKFKNIYFSLNKLACVSHKL